MFIPENIPSENTDRIVSAMQCFADLMIQMEMTFRDHLDAGRLSRAVALACDAEPVLGCRYVAGKRPFWERLDREDRNAFRIAVSETEYEDFRNLSIETLVGPQILVCLLQAEDGDRLLVKVAHEVADAGGVKDIVEVISRIYRELGVNPRFEPVPNLDGDRSANQLMKRIPLFSRPRIFMNYLRETWGVLVPPHGHSIPVTSRADDRKYFITRTFEADAVEYLRRLGRKSGASLNDILMTAIIRAHASMGNWDGELPLRLWTTIDNRRYLQDRKTDGICNLSAVEIITIGNRIGSTFFDTLSMVAALSARRKKSWLGLNTYIGLFPLMRLMSPDSIRNLMTYMTDYFTRAGIVQAALTNMGEISPERVKFDSLPVEAHMLVPPVFPPLLGYGLSGYKGTLTLSAGVYHSSTQPETVSILADRVISELHV